MFCQHCGLEQVRDRVGYYDKNTGEARWILTCPKLKGFGGDWFGFSSHTESWEHSGEVYAPLP